MSPQERRTADLVGALAAGGTFDAAICADSTLWDFERDDLDEPPSYRIQRLADAASWCRRCPCNAECAQLARTLGRSAWGVWAGAVLAAGRPISLRRAELAGEPPPEVVRPYQSSGTVPEHDQRVHAAGDHRGVRRPAGDRAGTA